MNSVLGPLLVVAAAAGGIALYLAIRRFERYRLTEAWRNSDARAAALSLLVFLGGLFGHRVPPPPRVQSAQAARPPLAGTDLSGRLRNVDLHSEEADRRDASQPKPPSAEPEGSGPAPPSRQSGGG